MNEDGWIMTKNIDDLSKGIKALAAYAGSDDWSKVVEGAKETAASECQLAGKKVTGLSHSTT